MPTLTCPQIKEIYDTFMLRLTRLHTQMSTADSSILFHELEEKATALRKSFFKLLNDSGKYNSISEECIKNLYQNVENVSSKDINGYHPLVMRNKTEIFCNPIADTIRDEHFKYIYINDDYGFWSVDTGDDLIRLYNPSTQEMSHAFRSARCNDLEGNWQLWDIDGVMRSYNPTTREYV